jgi:hypothetical protein
MSQNGFLKNDDSFNNISANNLLTKSLNITNSPPIPGYILSTNQRGQVEWKDPNSTSIGSVKFGDTDLILEYKGDLPNTGYYYKTSDFVIFTGSFSIPDVQLPLDEDIDVNVTSLPFPNGTNITGNVTGYYTGLDESEDDVSGLVNGHVISTFNTNTQSYDHVLKITTDKNNDININYTITLFISFYLMYPL